MFAKVVRGVGDPPDGGAAMEHDPSREEAEIHEKGFFLSGP
jgi:hypothetical protein